MHIRNFIESVIYPANYSEKKTIFVNSAKGILNKRKPVFLKQSSNNCFHNKYL